MGRRKLNLHWVSNDAGRRATFNKRCHGLMKKTSELSSLCGVKACVLVYGQNEVFPHVWPSIGEARDFLLTSYKATAELHQWNKKVSHEDFLKKRIKKLQGQVRKWDRESQGRETAILLHESTVGHRTGLVGVTPVDVIRLREVVERKTKAVQERLKRLGVQPEKQLPPWSSTMQMHGLAPLEEPQRNQKDMLTGCSSSADPSTPSTSGSGGSI